MHLKTELIRMILYKLEQDGDGKNIYTRTNRRHHLGLRGTRIHRVKSLRRDPFSLDFRAVLLAPGGITSWETCYPSPEEETTQPTGQTLGGLFHHIQDLPKREGGLLTALQELGSRLADSFTISS